MCQIASKDETLEAKNELCEKECSEEEQEHDAQYANSDGVVLLFDRFAHKVKKRKYNR